MQTARTLAIALLAALLLAACTINRAVKPVGTAGITDLCIKTNPKVMMADYQTELRAHIERKGIKTSLYEGERPATCRYYVEYTANWRWDLAMYLVYAEINVYDNGAPIGQAVYDAMGGGMNMNKFGSTSDKLKSLLDELFPKG